jgi:hypothetical protein
MTAVVLLVGSTMADAVGGISRSYRGVFEKLGYEFIEINLPDKERALQQIKNLAYVDVAFSFSFLGMGTDIMVNLEGGKMADIWEVLRIPYISLYGDSPAYFFDRHVLPNPGFVGLYGFPEHLELRRRFPNINCMLDTYPPVAIDTVAKDSIDFTKKATGPIIMLKNGNDPKKVKSLWAQYLPAKINGMMLEVVHELEKRLNDKVTTQIDDLLLTYFSSRSIDITAFAKLRLFMIAQLDDYLRRLKSTFVVEALLDFPILLNGYNWDHVDFSGRRMQYVPGGHYVASRALIQEALATIDVSPNTTGGPHDRPLRSIGAYTLCLTNEQEFFSTHLPHSADFFYRFDKDSMQARVADVLAHRQRSLDIGVNVAEAFMRKFQPEAFAHKLLDLAALARFNQLSALPDGMPIYFAWPPKKL